MIVGTVFIVRSVNGVPMLRVARVHHIVTHIYIEACVGCYVRNYHLQYPVN
jgi:hypothetical protein